LLEQIAATIAQNESFSNYDLHVLMTPIGGYDRIATKALIKLVAPTRTERVFVKICSSERLSRFLQSEAETLSAYSKLGIDGIPDVLASGSIEGRYYLAQRFVPGRTMHGRTGYLDEAVVRTKDWLTALHEKTQGPPVEADDLVRRARDQARTVSDFFDLGDCLALMERLSPRELIPTFRIHGDFWHRNILIRGQGGIWVTDFAFSAPGEPPTDLLDLISDYDPTVILDPARLMKYSGSLPVDYNAIPFLHLYSLVRKIGLKVDRRRHLHRELLINDLETSVNEISEVGIARRVVRHYKSENA
jgi:thiamine kinase-like enzyme